MTAANNCPRPADWPGPGRSVDLLEQDLPQASSTLEWWYVNGHVTDALSRECSVFASSFRIDGRASERLDDGNYRLRQLNWKHAAKFELRLVVGKPVIAAMPLGRAMSLISDRNERERLWDLVSSRLKDVAALSKAIERIEGCVALSAFRELARDTLEARWRQVDAFVSLSCFKLYLRACSWFVMDRQY